MHIAETRLRRLLICAIAGDAFAYRDFLDQLACHLRGYLRRRIPQSPDDVEDLIQATLLSVHNARHTYKATEPLTAWVHAIARSRLMYFFRSRALRESLKSAPDDDAELLAVFDCEPPEARRDIGKLLEYLPEKQRLSIVYVKLQGLPVAETALLTGFSESAVKASVYRGLKRLAVLIRMAAREPSIL